MGITTLGTERDSQIIDALDAEHREHVMLHCCPALLRRGNWAAQHEGAGRLKTKGLDHRG